MKPDGARGCVAIEWHPTWSCVVAQRYYGTLVRKATGVVSLKRKTECPGDTAAKLYGISNFPETGTFAKVGRASLAATEDRQHNRRTERVPKIIASFDLVHDLFRMEPKKE